MPRIDEPITVGTYPTRELAEAAAEHLKAKEIRKVEVEETVADVWQVKVPWPVADRATTVLTVNERRAIQTH